MPAPMDGDLAYAAAAASGVQPPPGAFAPHQRQRQQQFHRTAEHRHEAGEEEYEMEGELPNIDDLEVAAAAAGVAPVPSVLAEMGYFELGQRPTGAEEISESEEGEESSDEGSASDSDAEQKYAASSEAQVQLQLEFAAEDPDTVRIKLRMAAGVPIAAPDVDAEVAEDSSYMSSSAESSSDDDASIVNSDDDEPLDVVQNYDEIKRMIDGMDADVEGDADEDGGGGGASGAHRAEQELLGALPLPSLADLQIAPDEPVQVAGTVMTMLEGMVVIKAQGGSRALNEGCVLVLEDRTPIGCIEEIFGPVMSPLYALRYAGAGPIPTSLQAGTAVFSVDRLADFVLPEQLRVRGYDVGAEEEEEGDVEAQFSDDEAEAMHRRKLEAKRKQQPEGMPQGGRALKQVHSGRGRGGRRGGRAGRGGRASSGGRGAPNMQVPSPQQQQQHAGFSPATVAYYHPHQQQMAQPPPPAMPPAGRVFSGRLPRGPPAPAFQAQATAAQLNGMSLQQQQQQQQAMYMQPPPPVGYGGVGGGFYGGGQPPAAPHVTGQILRAQYAVPPPQRPPGMGAVMQPQYAPRPPMMQPPSPPQ